MSSLLVTELRSELTQNYNLSNSERYHIGSFVPYLYIHNAPAGDFTLNIAQGATSIATFTFTCADILTAMNTSDVYAHVFFPFSSETFMIMERGDFTVTLTASGGSYTYSDSSFLGWIRQHEDIQNIMNYTPNGDNENPLALRIKVFKEGVL